MENPRGAIGCSETCFIFLLYPYPIPTMDTLKKKIYPTGLIHLPSICKVERAHVLVNVVFSEHLLLGMLPTVGEDLLSYRAIPNKVTQTTRKLGGICHEEEQFPFPVPSFLGFYLLVFLYPRQVRIGCRLFPLGSVAGIGNYQRCFLVSRGRRQCWVSLWFWGPALPCSWHPYWPSSSCPRR